MPVICAAADGTLLAVAEDRLTRVDGAAFKVALRWTRGRAGEGGQRHGSHGGPDHRLSDGVTNGLCLTDRFTNTTHFLFTQCSHRCAGTSSLGISSVAAVRYLTAALLPAGVDINIQI